MATRYPGSPLAAETPDVLIVGGGSTGAGLLRDFARRGLRSLLIEKGDMGTGTSGRYHGLLHSGARYVVKDPIAARECIAENRVLRRIAPACIEDTGGFFVATPDDPDEYVEAFPRACAAAGVDCDEIDVADALAREPALDRRVRRVFTVPDAALEPWQLIEGNVADARRLGSDAWPYQRLIAMDRGPHRILGVTLRDERTGTFTRVAPRFVVSATGAWAGQVAALCGIRVEMSPGKGTMLVFNQRMTNTIVNRCHMPGDADIMVPVGTVAILGTTEERVDDPDLYDITRAEVEALLSEGEKLFPDLRRMRILRAYAGVRPLYQASDPSSSKHGPGGTETRNVSRAHVVLDHGADGVENFVSIVGGKLTTYRLMAEQTADVVCRKLSVTTASTTAEEPLPGQEHGANHWLGHRLAEHELAGGGDAALICECELVTRPMLDRFLDERWPCSLDDVRRGTRLGMGPCQGGFCTFRAAAILMDRTHGSDRKSQIDVGGAVAGGRAQVGGGLATAANDPAAVADAALAAFVRERFKGTRPVAWGRQLQELWLAAGVYAGVLGVDAATPTPTPASEHDGEALVTGPIHGDR